MTISLLVKEVTYVSFEAIEVTRSLDAVAGESAEPELYLLDPRVHPDELHPADDGHPGEEPPPRGDHGVELPVPQEDPLLVLLHDNYLDEGNPVTRQVEKHTRVDDVIPLGLIASPPLSRENPGGRKPRT